MRSPTRENARHLKQLLMGRAKASMRTFLLNSSGVAAVEFALLAPLLMLMTFGTFEITRALIAHKRFQRATAIVGVGIIVGLQNLKNGLSDTFTGIQTKLNDANAAAP
jgi:Flp pilus assembly protein TadG